MCFCSGGDAAIIGTAEGRRQAEKAGFSRSNKGRLILLTGQHGFS